MAIFIGYDYDGNVISVISAKSEENANAYWQGLNCLPHHSKRFDTDEQRENEKLGFVTPIVKTKEIEVRSDSYNLKMVRIIVK